MCDLAMGWLPKVEVSRIEEELGGESKTLRTIERLHEKYPDAQLRLIMGADIIVESAKWHRFDRISELAPPIILGRVGVSYEGAPPPVLPNISSTEVRAAFAEGNLAAIEPLVPKAVIEYARAKRLYLPSK
jgi:nicotinate-nucleotide adenylyltransferase